MIECHKRRWRDFAKFDVERVWGSNEIMELSRFLVLGAVARFCGAGSSFRSIVKLRCLLTLALAVLCSGFGVCQTLTTNWTAGAVQWRGGDNTLGLGGTKLNPYTVSSNGAYAIAFSGYGPQTMVVMKLPSYQVMWCKDVGNSESAAITADGSKIWVEVSIGGGSSRVEELNLLDGTPVMYNGSPKFVFTNNGQAVTACVGQELVLNSGGTFQVYDETTVAQLTPANPLSGWVGTSKYNGQWMDFDCQVTNLGGALGRLNFYNLRTGELLGNILTSTPNTFLLGTDPVGGLLVGFENSTSNTPLYYYSSLDEVWTGGPSSYVNQPNWGGYNPVLYGVGSLYSIPTASGSDPYGLVTFQDVSGLEDYVLYNSQSLNVLNSGILDATPMSSSLGLTDFMVSVGLSAGNSLLTLSGRLGTPTFRSYPVSSSGLGSPTPLNSLIDGGFNCLAVTSSPAGVVAGFDSIGVGNNAFPFSAGLLPENGGTLKWLSGTSCNCWIPRVSSDGNYLLAVEPFDGLYGITHGHLDVLNPITGTSLLAQPFDCEYQDARWIGDGQILAVNPNGSTQILNFTAPGTGEANGAISVSPTQYPFGFNTSGYSIGHVPFEVVTVPGASGAIATHYAVGISSTNYGQLACTSLDGTTPGTTTVLNNPVGGPAYPGNRVTALSNGQVAFFGLLNNTTLAWGFFQIQSGQLVWTRNITCPISIVLLGSPTFMGAISQDGTVAAFSQDQGSGVTGDPLAGNQVSLFRCSDGLPLGTSTTLDTGQDAIFSTDVNALYVADLSSSRLTEYEVPNWISYFGPGGTVSSGATGIGLKVTLTRPAGPKGVTVSLTYPAGVSGKTSLFFSSGMVSQSFPVSFVPVLSTTTYTVTATTTDQNVNLPMTTTFTETAPALVSVSYNPTSVGGGTTPTGTINVSGQLPSGAQIALTSSNPNVTVPSTVTTAAAGSTVTFTTGTAATTSPYTSTVKATFGGKTVSTVLGVNPTPIVFAVDSASVLGGDSLAATVTAAAPAPVGGLTYSVTSSSPSTLSVPSTVTIPQGSLKVDFSLNSNPVAVGSPVTVTVTPKGAASSFAVTQTVTVTPPLLIGAEFDPDTVVSGQSTALILLLSGPAAAGQTVSLSSNSSRLVVPATLTCQPGQVFQTFPFTTSGSGRGTAQVTVTVNGVSQAVTLTLTP